MSDHDLFCLLDSISDNVNRVAIVLAEFADVKMSAGVKQRMEDLWFSTGKIPTGSVTEFYKEVSNGKISLAGEVVGPFTLSKNQAYYANNSKTLALLVFR